MARCRKAGARSGHSTRTIASASVEAELVDLALGAQPVEVGVEDAEAVALVGLDQREGRRRHVERRVAHQRADDGAGERGLAGAEAAREQDQVAGPQHRRELCAERGGRGIVGEDDALRSTG